VQLLTIIGAMVALVATSVGVIAAIEQLTLRARLRRTAELAHILAEQEDNQRRRTVLRSVHDVAVARLASGWLVPWWRFTQFALLFVLGPLAVGWLAAQGGWIGSLAWLILTNFLLVGIMARRGVRLYLERQRVARDYIAGAEVAPPRLGMLELMEGGAVGKEYVVAALISAGTTLVGVSVGLLIHDPNAGWTILLIVVGLAISWFPADWLRARAVRPLATNRTPRKHSTGAS
jgi:hypothetical protein